MHVDSYKNTYQLIVDALALWTPRLCVPSLVALRLNGPRLHRVTQGSDKASSLTSRS